MSATMLDGRPPVVLRRRTLGAGQPRRMLLLHGLAGSESVWDAFLGHADAFGGHEVWSADMPWRADGAADWSAHRELVPYLAEALEEVPGGADVVVAHSMSANVLLDFLDRRLAVGEDPFRRYGIRRLVLVAPFYRRSPEEFRWSGMVHTITGFDRLVAHSIQVAAGDRLSEDLRERLTELVCDRVGPYGWIRFFETYLRTPQLRTARFTAPCLVVTGEHDFAAMPDEGAALAADLPLGTHRGLRDCGHFLMTEQPERFAAAVGEFVSSTPAVAPGPGPRAAWEHVR